MYSVTLDQAGNYYLMGGSGDESDSYSHRNATSPIPSSDIWVSYLIILNQSVTLVATSH